MTKYIDAEKLIANIVELRKELPNTIEHLNDEERGFARGQQYELTAIEAEILCLQQEQPDNMIQWTGSNLKEVIDFTGKSPRFGEWFKSWEEFETYVHQHNDILKLFCEDGSHYEVPKGAWIVKTPDGHNVPSVAKYVQQAQPEVDLEKEYKTWWNSISGKINIEHTMEWYMHETARHFWNKGYNARKGE